MSATGIGAAVRRKEDFRFITGKGQYTDDISRPGQSYIHFVRSPHAHPRSEHRRRGREEVYGRGRVLTGAELAADKSQPDLRLGAQVEGWFAEKMSAHPAIAAAGSNHVGDAVAW